MWIPIVTALFFSVALSMLFLIPSRKWGKILIPVYIALSLAFAGGEMFLKQNAIDDAVSDIDPEEVYTDEDYQKKGLDLTLKLLVIDLINLVPVILLLIIGVGALMNTKKLEEELKPKMDSRLYSLKL